MNLERLVRRLVGSLEARDPGGIHRPISVAELRRELVPYRSHRTALGLSNSEDYELMILRLVAEEGGWVRTFPPEAALRARREVSEPNPDLELTESLGEVTVQIGAAALARLQQPRGRSSARQSSATPEPAPPVVAEPAASSEPPTTRDAAPTPEPPAPIDFPVVPESAVEAIRAVDELLVPGPAAKPEESGPIAEAPVSQPPVSRRSEPPPQVDPPEPIESVPVEPDPPAPIPLFDALEEQPAVDLARAPTELPPLAVPVRSHCPSCGGQIPTDRPVVFCPHCGDRVGVLRCLRCGTELEAGWRHCVMCGYRMPGIDTALA
jgi:predicted RNA-binding Zn-ribbon protein involved in translation (DUF1610 family)